MENDLPIVVFDLNGPDNIARVAFGESVGTLISAPRPAAEDAGMTAEIISPRITRWPAPSRSWTATCSPSAPVAPRPGSSNAS